MAARRLDCPFVFHIDGVPVGDWRKTWDRACKLAGVPGKLLHDCRRTAARNLVRAGVPESVAMKLTGHKTRNAFLRYDITSEGDLRRGVDALAKFVEQQPTEPSLLRLAKAAGNRK